MMENKCICGHDKFSHLREYAGNIEKAEDCDLCKCQKFNKEIKKRIKGTSRHKENGK